MYRIIGGDGKEYGPISDETLREWIAQGRANAETQVLREGDTSWRALGSIPEFAGTAPAVAGPDQVGAPAESGSTAALRLATPAGWALFIVGILSVLMSIGLLVWTMVHGMEKNPFLEKFMSAQGTSEATRMGQQVGYYAALIVGIAWGGLITIAGVKLRRLESWGLVLTGAIFAIVPCCGTQFPLCLLSAPVGIWAIVVICQAKVKSAFT